MKELGRYIVTHRVAYRDHPTGTMFEAALDPLAESRAISRGSIRLVERLKADLPCGKYRLPAGWSTYQPARKEG